MILQIAIGLGILVSAAWGAAALWSSFLLLAARKNNSKSV